jgi:Big-like domain-containing protein
MASFPRSAIAVLAFLFAARPEVGDAGGYTLVGWNNLGMHCMDADFSVLATLPPFNTIDAQLIDPQGNRVADPPAAGITVTYEAVVDASGSVNTTAIGKTNFWDHAQGLFGASPPPDVGLAGFAMPGPANTPRPMTWIASAGWFEATGIPITPYDDTMAKNPYPMMRLTARDAQGTVLATTDVVLPVSDEMDCRSCHSSGSGPAAQPSAGWVNDPDPQRDMRFNILRLHDQRQAADPAFQAALAAAGYDAGGLEQTVRGTGRAILCATCHASEALGTGGQPGVAPLTQSMHGMHANVVDPTSGATLDATTNRSACYRCHPGAVTRCLRGAMGSAVAPDGSLAMQCQSCHGQMHDVGSPSRTGWLNEPACQSCHSGTAMTNSGQIRFLSAFDVPGHYRVPADSTFATTADAPLPGLDLYRFSTGHGGLKCEACHGSTHAEFPASHVNDNVASIEHQGHEGMLVECATCHGTTPDTVAGGPHGMHPVGQDWVSRHPDRVESSGAGACRACHGMNYRGTVLSRAKADRTLSAFGTKTVWRGFQIGCYTCHSGPSSESANPNHAPVIADAVASTPVGVPVAIVLAASDVDHDPVTLRIVSQPSHGTVGLADTIATYVPEPGFVGDDTFTAAASDGSTDSNLGVVTVHVGIACTGRDLDGDGVPDRCDPVDAALAPVRAAIRATKTLVRATAKGTFVVAAGDVFDASAVVTVTIRDGGSTVMSYAWAPSSCLSNARGAIQCKSTDGANKSRFVPNGQVSGGWKFTAKLKRAGSVGDLVGPVTVVVSHGDGVDRVGQVAACKAGTRSLACK